MKLYNPFRFLSRFEWGLMLFSMTVVTASFFLGGGKSVISLIASLIGVVALIFVAKGDVTGQFLCILFSIFYAFVSWKQRYYGEMMTYVCMSLPASLASVISWLKHPYSKERQEVRMIHMRPRDWLLTVSLAAVVTFCFYWILRYFGTAALPVSTVSVATSFFAAFLLWRRSPFYALGYAANDVVLIVLWCIAAVKDPSAWAMVACFAMFLCNDLYALYNWLRVRGRQSRETRRRDEA